MIATPKVTRPVLCIYTLFLGNSRDIYLSLVDLKRSDWIRFDDGPFHNAASYRRVKLENAAQATTLVLCPQWLLEESGSRQYDLCSGSSKPVLNGTRHQLSDFFRNLRLKIRPGLHNKFAANAQLGTHPQQNWINPGATERLGFPLSNNKGTSGQMTQINPKAGVERSHG